MAGIKPLDLSFLQNYRSQMPNSTNNIASMLLANGGWTNLSNETQNEIAYAQQRPQHRVSGISRLIDLLSTPTYALAGAANRAIMGHQSDSNDSIMSDIGKSLEGAGKGFFGGLGAGLRGTFGTDEQASNPSGKTHFDDVIDRLYFHMSSAEANDPQNFQKVKEYLAKAKVDQLGGNGKNNLLYPDGVSDDDVRKFLKQAEYSGIASDIVTDPLNFAKPFKFIKMIKDGVLPAKEVADIPQVWRDANNASKFDSPDRALSVPDKAEVQDISSKLTPKLAAPKNFSGSVTVPGTLPMNVSMSPKIARAGMIDIPKLGKLGQTPNVSGIPEVVSDATRGRITKEIIKTISQGNDPKWIYKVSNRLNQIGTGEFPQTLQFLQNVRNAEKAGKRINLNVLAKSIPRRLSIDIDKMRQAEHAKGIAEGTIPAEGFINSGQGADVILNRMSRLPAHMNSRQTNVAFNVIRKYQSRILGKAAPTTERFPGAMNNAIAKGKNARYSGPQQVNLFQSILYNGYKNAKSAKKFDSATNILEHIENYFIHKGAVPYSAVKIDESHNLRLSHVLRAIGPQAAVMNRKLLTKILAGDPEAIATLPPEAVQKIEALKAGEAMASAPAVQAAIFHGEDLGRLLKAAPMAPARKIPLTQKVINDTKNVAISNGGGLVGAHVAGRYIVSHFNIGEPIGAIYKSNKLDLAARLAEAARMDKKFTPVDKKTIKRLNKSLSNAMQSPPVRDLGKVMGAGARVAEWIGARINANYGNADFRPIFLKHQASAYATSAARSRYLNGLRREYGTDPDLWSAAMKSAQGNLAPSADDAINGLSSEIQRIMESLFGGSGIREGAMAQATVAARVSLTMNMLNSNLKRFGLGGFKFTNAKDVKDVAGIAQDYSEGIDWLKSWESWNIKSPYKFLHQIQAAVDYSAHENAMFDEIASRFGSFAKLGTGKDAVKYGINHPKFKGVYFNAEAARQGEVFLKIIKDINAPTSEGLRQVQKVLSKFKAAVTIYWPIHHVNNLVGDTFMNWYAGVNSITPYTMAIRVMRSQHNQYTDIEELGMLTSPNALKDAIEAAHSAKPFSERSAGNEMLFKMRNGFPVSNDMVATAAHRVGILPSGRILEDIGFEDNTTSVLDKIGLPGKFRGRGQEFAHRFSETRDHFPRYAQFIDHLMKSPKPFEQAIEDAGNLVRKWHPDGLDITKFERNTLKTIFPFYSWMRKAIPLVVESAMTAPGKIKAYPQLMEAIQIYNGVDPEHAIDQPFPSDSLFPDWMREKGIGPIHGGPGNYTIINPSVPAQDVFSAIFTPKKTIEGYLNPLIKVPIESVQGHEMMTNQGIGGNSSQSYPDYFLKQTPVVNNLGRMSGQFGVSQAGSQSSQLQNFLNLLGARMSNSGPYEKSAEFDLRDYLKSRRG